MKISDGIQSYVMDIEFIKETNEVFLIELNAFGAEFSAASCLFHWLRDNSILENHNDKNCEQEVLFRVLSSNTSVEEIERVPPIFHFY